MFGIDKIRIEESAEIKGVYINIESAKNTFESVFWWSFWDLGCCFFRQKYMGKMIKTRKKVSKSVSNRLKNTPGSVWGWTWKKNGHKMPGENGPPLFFDPFWRTFAALRRHFGPTWRQMAAQGCQNGGQNRWKIDAKIEVEKLTTNDRKNIDFEGV